MQKTRSADGVGDAVRAEPVVSARTRAQLDSSRDRRSAISKSRAAAASSCDAHRVRRRAASAASNDPQFGTETSRPRTT